MFVDMNPELLTKEMITRIMVYVEKEITMINSR